MLCVGMQAHRVCAVWFEAFGRIPLLSHTALQQRKLDVMARLPVLQISVSGWRDWFKTDPSLGPRFVPQRIQPYTPAVIQWLHQLLTTWVEFTMYGIQLCWCDRSWQAEEGRCKSFEHVLRYAITHRFWPYSQIVLLVFHHVKLCKWTCRRLSLH